MNRRIAALCALALAACHDPPSGSADPTADAAPSAADEGEAGEAGGTAGDPGQILRVSAKTLALGEDTVALRPTTAPGVVDAELRATYAYKELQGKAVDKVAVDAAATTAALRGVLASLAPTEALTFESEGKSVDLHLAAGVSAYMRPRGGKWQLRVDEALRAEGDSAAAIAGTTEKTIALDPPDDFPAGKTLEAARQLAAAGIKVVLAIDYAPCVEAPPGMSCVPGGPAIVGNDDGPAEEAPRRELLISTLYIDQREATNADFDKCHEAGACRIRINRYQKIMAPFVGPDQPAMPMDWHRARAYCAWAGKRLPTEWEWEKAARGPDGELFPWGDEEPTCERAIYRECAPVGCKPYPGKPHRWDCNEHNTRKVGSFPAGRYGLHEMAGNGYEWTATAGIESIAECGAACNGRDPLGPCDGASPCKGRRILKGGSWYWPKHRTKGSHRRLEKVRTGSHRLGMRCATSNPFLTNFSPERLADKRERAADPKPPTEEQLAIFAGFEEDPIDDKPICGAKVREEWGPLQEEGGRSEVTCRDPFPYLMSNEPRAHLWQPYIENLGGAYVGIGSDQNYSYIAIVRPQWAWVVDYDPRVYYNHLRLRVLILASDSPEEFVEFFDGAHDREAIAVIMDAFKGDPDLMRLRRGFSASRLKLHPYFVKQLTRPFVEGFGWLSNPEHFAYIKLLLQHGRLRPVRGDLLGDKAMRSIGDTARKLDVPVRVYYTSNAPSSWGGEVTDAYRRNVLGLPFDRHSLVLQTNSRGGFGQTGKWHMSITWGHLHHERLRRRGYDSIPKLLEDRIPGHHGDVTLLGVPSF